jgi:hypothetical protein
VSLSATDRLDILDLYARAAYHLDFGEPEKYVALFTADGVLVRQTGDEVDLRRSGAAELLEFAQDVVQRNGRTGQHWNSNITIESSSEGAIGTCHTMLVVARAETRSHQIASTGQCRDRFTRTATGWRFKERVFVQPW